MTNRKHEYKCPACGYYKLTPVDPKNPGELYRCMMCAHVGKEEVFIRA